MSTEIHLFLEIDYSSEGPLFDTVGSIRSFAYGEFFVRTNYDLFDVLAGARSRTSPNGKQPLIKPRGLPPIISNAVYNRYFLIVDDPSYQQMRLDGVSSLHPNPKTVSKAQAERWVQEGLSVTDETKLNAAGQKARVRVSDPDWHSTSWLTLSEAHASILHGNLTLTTTPIEFQLILYLMTEIETRLGGQRTRLVFWFDN